MINSIFNDINNTKKYLYRNQHNNVNNFNIDTEESTLGKDIFEKSDQLTEEEKDKKMMEEAYNSMKNTIFSKNNRITKDENVTILTPDDPHKLAEDIVNASNQIDEYRKTPEGQELEHEYEQALKEEKSAKFQGKSQEELSKLSKNASDIEAKMYDNISGVPDSVKQGVMKMDNDVFYSGAVGKEYQLVKQKNDDLLSNNAKNYIDKLRQENQDTTICINDTSNFSINGDYIGYVTCIDKNLFELMANNQKHDDIWNKLVNNQYDNFDEVVSDISKSGDSTLANEFKTDVEDYNSRISRYYHF